MGFRRHGPFQAGDQVQLTDPKNKRHTVTLKEDGVFHTHKGGIPHSELIGQPEGSVVRSSGGTQYLAFRHLLQDYTLSMPRGAAVIYPKDVGADRRHGRHLPRRPGRRGGRRLRRADLLPAARRRAGGPRHLLRAARGFRRGRPQERGEVLRRLRWTQWRLVVGDFVESLDESDVDRVILDMLAPWECVDAAAKALTPGGVICCYVATTTQLSKYRRSSFANTGVSPSLMRGRPWFATGMSKGSP